jgi:hypothetical protein
MTTQINFAQPALTDAYTSWPAEIQNNVVVLAFGLDDTYSTYAANPPAGTKRFSSALNKWQVANGSGAWSDMSSAYAINISGTAAVATNLAGGSAGTVPYQSASGTTVMLSAGTSGFVFKANGAAAPSWVDPATLTVGTAGTANALNTANNYQGNSVGIGMAAPAVAGNLAVAGAAYTAKVALTYGATTTLNCQLSNSFRVILTGNITTFSVTNPYDGQIINVRFLQDATGSRTIAWPSAFKWAGGTVPVLSTAGSAKDFLSAQYDAADATWNCSLLKGLA